MKVAVTELSQFILLKICGWIPMEKKIGPIHRTTIDAWT